MELAILKTKLQEVFDKEVGCIDVSFLHRNIELVVCEGVLIGI